MTLDELKKSFSATMSNILKNGDVKSQVDKIIQHLQIKYQKKFIPISYGDRYDKLDDDITIIVYPEDDPKLVFKASGNNKDKYEDNYLERKVFTEIEKNVEKGFLNYKSNVKVSAVINRRLSYEETVQEYISQDHFLIAMIVVNSENAFENVEKVLYSIKQFYQGLKIKSFVFLLDEENFVRFVLYSKESQEITTTMVRKYMPKKEKIVN